MGIEVMSFSWSYGSADTDVVGGDYSYMTGLFCLVGASASANNWTGIEYEGQSFTVKTYTYDSDGYPISGTVTNEVTLNFTIEY